MSSTARRLRVLLCWGYHRRGWIAPFEELDREFEFHYVFHRRKQEEECSHTKRPRYYWNDFHSAQQLLDQIRPDRLVFMSLAGLRAIALNMAARRRRIPTFVLQHGYFRSLEDYLALPAAQPSAVDEDKTAQAQSAWRAVRFMLRSNAIVEPIDSIRAVAMLLVSRRTDLYRSQLRFRFRGRLPDRYITYSEATSQIHRQLDNASSSSIVPIGMPEFDPVFRRLAMTELRSSTKVLLIDSPNAGNRYGVATTTIERKARFLRELADSLAERGYKLVVKLHPETYDADWLPPEIEYVRDHDVGQLIEEAHACVGFDSTLTIPAVIARPALLFELCESTLTADARALGVATVLRGLEWKSEHLDTLLDKQERSPEQIDRFTRRFAHVADGNATKRLGDALRHPATEIE